MSKLRIEKPKQGKKKSGKLPIGLVGLLLLGGAVYVFGIPVEPPPPLEITNFAGTVEVRDKSGETHKPDRGSLLLAGQTFFTGDSSEADLQLPGKVKVRVKANTQVVYGAGWFFEKKIPLRFLVRKGELFAATEKGLDGQVVQLQTPDLAARSAGGYYYVRSDLDSKKSSIGLMRGVAEVKRNQLWVTRWTDLHGLESVDGGEGVSEIAPHKVSKDEWKQLSELYELAQKSAAVEAMQLDLSKQGGSLFDFVFDHGTFYTPKVGYCGREFYKDENSGEVYLDVEYDVFPKGSFVGMYIKTRALDISQYSSLEFEMRRAPDEGFPQSIRIEMKDRSGIVRAFAAKLPKTDWEKVSFPLNVRNSTDLTEIAFVFLHERVGEDKKGTVQMRRINLVKGTVSEPVLPAQPVEASKPAQESSPAAVGVEATSPQV